MRASKPLHLPWHHADSYWLCAFARDAASSAAIAGALPEGFTYNEAMHGHCQPVPKQWGASWQALFHALTAHNLATKVDVAIIPGHASPDQHTGLSRKTVTQIQAIADSLWLGDAVLSHDVMCYLQPVLDRTRQVVGYESFARARTNSGTIVTGEAIVAASKTLGIEFGIDRLLQVSAVETFSASGQNGYLFVNFFPGFIQRPEVYLDGLTEAVKLHKLSPSHVALDFTGCETPHDIHHIKRVSDYCRAKGYAIALDDVESVGVAQHLVEEVKPDFLKLDMKLVKRAGNSNDRETIRQIVAIAQAGGTRVIAEGIEDEETCTLLLAQGVDYLQGYYFAKPLPASELKALKFA